MSTSVEIINPLFHSSPKSPHPNNEFIDSASLEETLDVQKLLDILRINGVSLDDLLSIRISKESPNELPVHFTSVCYFVTLTFKNTEKLELFVKRLKGNAEIKEEEDFSLFEKEAALYTKVVPCLSEFCVQRSGSQDMLEMLPKVYFASDGEIIMENLMSQSYSVLDRSIRHDLAQASLVLETLGKFHGASYALIQEVGGPTQFLEKFPETQEKMFKRWGVGYKINEMMIDSTLVKLTSFLKVSTLTGSDSAYQVLSKYTNCGFSTMCGVVEGTHLLRVLNHGDCWGNNIMFHQKAVQSSETDIKLLDYQMTRIGSPNLDIAYYMYNSVAPEVRKSEQVITLLGIYYKEFKQCVQSLKGEVDFTLKDLIEDYGRISKLGFLYGVYIAAASPLMGKVELDNSQNWIEDFVNAIADHMENYPKERDCVLAEVISMVHDFSTFGSL